MDLLKGYKGESSSESEDDKPALASSLLRRPINSRPNIDTVFDQPQAIVTTGGNVTVAKTYKKLLTGIVEETFIDSASFASQYATFQSRGFANDPSGKLRHVGDLEAMRRFNGVSAISAQSSNDQMRAVKRRKLPGGRASDVHDFKGPWAPMTDEEEWRKTALEKGTMTSEQKQNREEWLAKQKKPVEEEGGVIAEKEPRWGIPMKSVSDLEVTNTKSIFHGEQETDYLGRPWTHPPSDLHADDGDHKCFVPKKLEHTWVGHNKGVQSIRFFPKYGHLLLSGSMDTKVKIWDVLNKRQCQRTYLGHTAGVRDVNFNNEGDRFLSASFDKTVKLWDTETGDCIGSYGNKKMLYCATFYPLDNNVFLSGCSNKKIIQFDARTGEIVQEYDHHLGAVNTVSFYDEGRRFATTSDDKKLLLWEYNIPVPIKYISDPAMHSMPAVAIGSNNVFAGQSLDNTIKCYNAKDRFRQMHNKTFKGHSNAGYACQVGFSPDSRFLLSGDGDGKLWFWDWKTRRVIRKMKAHNKGPCIGAIWHPLEASKVASCGWDGVIKLWD